jgi:hypothetical protein
MGEAESAEEPALEVQMTTPEVKTVALEAE